MATSNLPVPRKLWEHPNPTNTRMWKFMQKANKNWGLRLETFQDLYKWSVGARRTEFWEHLWKEIDLVYEGSFDKPVDTTAHMDTIPHWFSGVRLNFAENILYTPSPSSPSTLTTYHKEDFKTALTQIREGNTEVASLSYGALRARVGLLSNALRAAGVRKGDRVALVASNSFDTLVCFLATAALGGLWSSSSTDMGVKGVLDRLVQIRPKFVFVDDWAVYNGKTVDLRPKIKEVVAGLRNVEEFEAVVVQPRFEQPADLRGVKMAVGLGEFLKKAGGDERVICERVEFRDPFLIVYSSGTTGVPKCIVHSTGGVLVSAMKEGKLHRDSGPDTVLLQYTTTGWIMYMSAVLTLLWGGRSVLYDGSPFQPDLTTFMKTVGEQRVTNLGTSPKYLHELQKNNLSPREITDLSALRAVTSTGMVLSDSLFEWFYDAAFPPAVHLANIAGGTDLAACFGMENPLTPVYVGGCQGPSLGTKVEVYDSTIEGGPRVRGKRVEDGVPGELVATASFPNQPVFFWGPTGHSTYQSAYFSRFTHVWTHGDFIQIHPLTKQMFFLGRADGVLNPSGVRFGSAEIYSIIENHFPEIQDSICVGQRRPQDADESVMLFLLMVKGERFEVGLVERVREAIGRGLSKRHVPKYVFETFEIPTTVNLKKVELPVKHIVSGRTVKPSGTLLNPESLEYYYQFAKVEEMLAKQGLVKSKL